MDPTAKGTTLASSYVGIRRKKRGSERWRISTCGGDAVFAMLYRPCLPCPMLCTGVGRRCRGKPVLISKRSMASPSYSYAFSSDCSTEV
jgi:hypothetical protein